VSDPTPPAATLFDTLGGADGVRALVDRFYTLMDTLPEAAVIRAMHPADLTESADKLYEFLSGWAGGPPLYVAKRGHPRLRGRHMPFAVDTSAATAWMLCMTQALDEQVPDPALRLRLQESLTRVALHMRNRPG
jgi:hemoglobin